MENRYRYGQRVYYVPKYDQRLARYVPITRLHLSLNPPMVVLAYHISIAPRLDKWGNVARDRVGTYWISKEAYEAHCARPSAWQRLTAWAHGAFEKIAETCPKQEPAFSKQSNLSTALYRPTNQSSEG